MSKKNLDTFQTKITRNDRFAQMSQQEKLIEQKKREILAKLDAKEKTKVEASKARTETPKPSSKSDGDLKNAFSNDGSFLDQFKQLKETKKSDSKLRSFSKSKDRFSDDKNKPNNRWGPRRRSPSPKDPPKRMSRFSNDKMPSFESKITISTSFTNSLVQQQPIPPPSTTLPVVALPVKTQDVTGQPLLKNIVPPASFEETETTSDIGTTFVPTPIFPTVNLPLVTTNVIAPVPPPVELAAIPPPNPIQVQNIPQPAPLNALTIPQPEPLNALTIPQPAPLQVQNIPTPQPLDLLAIPTPGENVSGREFLMSVPPPNKSVPPPQMAEAGSSIPSLMAQPIFPPLGMGLNINVSCPPPGLGFAAGQSMRVPPPGSAVDVGGGRYGDVNAGSPEYESMVSLGRTVAECGDGIEDIVRQRKNQDPHLWFLFHQESAAYRQYRHLIDRFKAEAEVTPKIEEPYEPEMALEDEENFDEEDRKSVRVEEDESAAAERKRKRKSRWGEKERDVPPPSVVVYDTLATPIANPTILPTMAPQTTSAANQAPVLLSKVGRHDPGLLQYAVTTYGTADLPEEDWKKIEDHYKISLLYQDMLRKRAEAERLLQAGKHKYEYDSDEDTEGGTWEHKARDKEMTATEVWASELNRQAEGKHHIGDFLPPGELERFLEKSSAAREGREPNLSDYKEFKIKEDNVGFRMLQKLGWSEGEGLGNDGAGIVEPVNKAPPRENTQGLGLNFNQPEEDEDEYESYRKRMMLAYRFRPNPLNNPRRPYY